MKKMLMIFAVLVLVSTAVWARGASSGAGGVTEISAVLQLSTDIVIQNNPVIQMMERDLNVKLNIEAPPPSGFGDRVKMLVASGNMPDLVHYGADIFATQWAQEGLILDVTDRIAQYPNLRDNISREQYGDCIFLPDGRIYGIPRPNTGDKFGFVINKKWLDNVGLPPPKTVAEFVEVCRRFTFNDPNKSGRQDTYGATFGAEQSSMDSGIWHLLNDFFSMAYSISSWHHGMPDVDRSAKLRPLKSRYPDYLRQMRQMYADGIIDREFITHNSGDNVHEKLAQGRVGIVGASESNYTTNVLEKYNLSLDDFIYCPPLVLDASQKPMYAMPPSCWMAYYVKANTTPQKQDAVLRVLDWGNSEKGFTAMQMGIAGTHYSTYDINSRTVNRTTAQADALRRVTSNMFGFANAYKNLPPLQGGSTPAQIAKWQIEARAADSASTKVFFGFTKMLDNIGANFPDIVTNLNSLEVRYITGQVQWEQLDTYIKNTYAPATAGIASEFSTFMQRNPARYVN
ncbi:MAG: extracellular solute-binding protein [Treponema sp.]|jgi:ABC-type glycerol-3-phosphate transport system substrate-binding protein|nr:extracellular solute-binding protein [Treponema sp.]